LRGCNRFFLRNLGTPKLRNLVLEELAPPRVHGVGIGAVLFVEFFDEGDIGAEIRDG
jgi:hypothetical protein